MAGGLLGAAVTIIAFPRSASPELTEGAPVTASATAVPATIARVANADTVQPTTAPQSAVKAPQETEEPQKQSTTTKIDYGECLSDTYKGFLFDFEDAGSVTLNEREDFRIMQAVSWTNDSTQVHWLKNYTVTHCNETAGPPKRETYQRS